jgi:hypothetical protein
VTDYLKRGQTTAPDWEKATNCDLCYGIWVKSDSDIYYNKTSDKAATK